MTCNKNVLTVGSPRRFVHAEIFVFDNGVRVGAVGVHDPQIVLAGTIANEGDVLSIGGETGMGVESDAALLREALGVAAGDRHAIDVREKIEDDPLAVGRNIDGHPGAFGSVEGDLAGGATGERGVPFFFGLVFLLLIIVTAREGRERKGCDEQEK
jgi:hypothetical protein